MPRRPVAITSGSSHGTLTASVKTHRPHNQNYMRFSDSAHTLSPFKKLTDLMSTQKQLSAKRDTHLSRTRNAPKMGGVVLRSGQRRNCPRFKCRFPHSMGLK